MRDCELKVKRCSKCFQQSPDYLRATLDLVLNVTNDSEKSVCAIVVLLTDADHAVRTERAAALYAAYSEHVDSGLMQIVAPPHNIYPDVDYEKIHRDAIFLAILINSCVFFKVLRY